MRQRAWERSSSSLFTNRGWRATGGDNIRRWAHERRASAPSDLDAVAAETYSTAVLGQEGRAGGATGIKITWKRDIRVAAVAVDVFQVMGARVAGHGMARSRARGVIPRRGPHANGR